MKKIALLFLLLIVFGCSDSKEPFGKAIENRESTSIDSIMKNPEQFAGKAVTVEGQIINECPSGCWFDMRDENGAIYVDIAPGGFAIPQKVGKDVVVEGKVSLRDGKPIIVGKGVEVE